MPRIGHASTRGLEDSLGEEYRHGYGTLKTLRGLLDAKYLPLQLPGAG